MKVIIVIWCLFAVIVAEAPPSNSYLPPPASNHNAGFSGYPSSGLHGHLPDVVAARSLAGQGFGHSGSGGIGSHGYSRNGSPSHVTAGFGSHQSRHSPEHGYDESAQTANRNLLEQLNQEPANYNFEYMVNDVEEGTDFGHQEERVDESAHGEYHVVLPDGRKQTVAYEADEKGYKPRISYEESELSRASSGYDANANNADHNQHGGRHHGNGAGRNGY